MADVGLDLQLYLWSMIDKRREKHKNIDYLQVFELEVIGEGKIQVVNYSQEQPDIKEVYFLPEIENPYHGKLYAIDDGEHSTLMLASDY